MNTPQFINGQWLNGHDLPFSSINPSNGATVWHANGANAEDVDLAVKSARKALSTWAKKSLDARLAIVNAFKLELEKVRMILPPLSLKKLVSLYGKVKGKYRP
jgi:succinylglutamic semialdehyde dehydrogenase (EC 1.2.1.-)